MFREGHCSCDPQMTMCHHNRGNGVQVGAEVILALPLLTWLDLRVRIRIGADAVWLWSWKRCILPNASKHQRN